MQKLTAQQSIAYFLATGFYSGLSRIMPGTAGTAVSALLLFALEHFFPIMQTVGAEVVVAVILTVIAIETTAKLLQSGMFGESTKDPQIIVIDEFAGFAVALLGVGVTWQAFLAAFVMFRFFDMTKIWPISRFERLPGAYGIVADDIVAGIFAAIALYVFVPL